MGRKYKYPRSITRAEAERAVYLDFESHEDSPPYLAGRLIGDDLRLTVLDPELYPAASGSSKYQADISTLDDYVRDLAGICLTERRRLIAFSQIELELIDQYMPQLPSGIERSYGNALPFVRRWFKENLPETFATLERRAKKRQYYKQQGVGLKDYLSVETVPCEFPQHLKRKYSPSRRAKEVRKQLGAKDGVYSALSPGAKRGWTFLLEYNGADCECLRCLTLFVLN